MPAVVGIAYRQRALAYVIIGATGPEPRPDLGGTVKGTGNEKADNERADEMSWHEEEDFHDVTTFRHGGKTRRAAKDYSCRACGADIPAGTEYFRFESVALVDGEFMTMSDPYCTKDCYWEWMYG